jgi:ribonuclease BN (tRNA processing enzyme)
MELTILGSGTGIPSLRRGSPGSLVQVNGVSILMDSGSGSLQRLLQTGVTYKDLDLVLYSHVHPDHVADLVPLLFACKYMEDPRTKDLAIIGGNGFRDYFEALRTTYGHWVESDDYHLEIKEMSSDTLDIFGVGITTRPTKHTPESVGYRLESPDGKTLVYSGDTGYCSNIVHLAADADVVLLETSFPDEFQVPGHLTPSSAGRVAQEAGCKRVVLTHMYPPCDAEEVQRECQKLFQGEVIVAEDMMTIQV